MLLPLIIALTHAPNVSAAVGANATQLTLTAAESSWRCADALRPACLHVAKATACAFAQQGHIGGWLLLCDRRAETATNLELKCGWLLARGIAEEYAIKPKATIPLAGEAWFAMALSVAESDACRFECVRLLAEGYRDQGQLDEAISLVRSVEGQFDAQYRAALSRIKH